MSRRGRAERPAVEVEIAGEKHVLRSDAPPEYTRAVAAHVDQTIRDLGVPTLEPHRSAILAALFITDELFRAREQLSRLEAEVARRSAALAETLERAAGDAARAASAPPAPDTTDTPAP